MVGGLKKIFQKFWMYQNILFRKHQNEIRRWCIINPRKKPGKRLKPEAKWTALDFYPSDGYSLEMLGKNYYVSISFNVHEQKHLLFCYLKELYQEFKVKKTAMSIEFSKFTSLCPEWCVTIGDSVIHSVCVCSIH